MTCIEWRVIPMANPERDQDVVKQEASGSKSRCSYVLGRSYSKIPNPIMGYANTL